MLTCFIRYQIDPFKKAEFERYSRAWGEAIPRCGADLIGYFAPHEGSATLAYGVYNIASLAAYEEYRARLAADAQGRENYEFARSERFILREDRTFLEVVLEMIAVIFEVEPHPAQRDTYFRIAAELRPLLDEIDGFISIERFQSFSDERRILSLSFWRDEAAVAQWRSLEAHRAAQSEGRARVLQDYRLRVAHVVRDYGLNVRNDAPNDLQNAHGV